jgi:hypothetical protein
MDNLEKALDEFGREFIKELTTQLLNADKKATGDLINSLDYQVVETIDGFMLNILSSPYLNYVDKGRKPGIAPPSSKFIKWIDARNIKWKDKKGKIIPKESVAFLIARSIGRKGIKPTNVIQKTINNIFTNKQKILEQAAIKDIEALIEKILIIS